MGNRRGSLSTWVGGGGRRGGGEIRMMCRSYLWVW